jgi:hypothetical protein
MLGPAQSILASRRVNDVIKTRAIVPALLAVFLSAQAGADDLTDAAQGLCDSIRTCALESISKEDLTPEVLDMMGPMLDNMCANMRSKVQEVPMGDGLYEPAVGCMRSLESLTCEQMQSPDQAATPECKEYERLAREAGVVPQ